MEWPACNFWVQVQNGEIVNEISSEAVQTNADELAKGLLTEELFVGETWFPDEMWVSTEEMIPSTNWSPGEMWTPTEMEDVAISQNELNEEQTLVVVYTHVPLDTGRIT